VDVQDAQTDDDGAGDPRARRAGHEDDTSASTTTRRAFYAEFDSCESRKIRIVASERYAPCHQHRAVIKIVAANPDMSSQRRDALLRRGRS
jgi:hypothetical protein